MAILADPMPRVDHGTDILWDAFARHLEDHLRREITDELDAADAARWAPVRARLAVLRNTPTWAEQQALRRPKPAHQLRATPGWPPIAIPGQPGQYLTYDENGQNAA
jgi:hypothetical protein